MSYVVSNNAANPYSQYLQPVEWAAFENSRPGAYNGEYAPSSSPNNTPETGGSFWQNLGNQATSPNFLNGVAGLITAVKGGTAQNQNDNAALFSAMQEENKKQQSMFLIVGAVIVLVVVSLFIFKKS